MPMDRDHVGQACKLGQGVMPRPQNNVCMASSSCAPSSNPNSGCVSPETDVAPAFPPPQAHVQPQIPVQHQQLTGAQEAERKQLKRSLSHCTSLPANVRVTTSAASGVANPPVHVKRLCSVGRSDVKHEPGQLVLITAASVQNSASPPPKEETKHVSNDGLYMLAEQAERRVARDSSASGSSSRRASPECEGVRIRAASMSASDFKYRERFFSPSFKVCILRFNSALTQFVCFGLTYDELKLRC